MAGLVAVVAGLVTSAEATAAAKISRGAGSASVTEATSSAAGSSTIVASGLLAPLNRNAGATNFLVIELLHGGIGVFLVLVFNECKCALYYLN